MPSGRFSSLSSADQCLVADTSATIDSVATAKGLGLRDTNSVKEQAQDFLAEPAHLRQLKAEFNKSPDLLARVRARCGPE